MKLDFQHLFNCFSLTKLFDMQLDLHVNLRFGFAVYIGLVDDWSTKSVPDLYHFVPYTWTINLQIKDFELVLLTNEYNWIDTSSSYAENGKIYT